MVQVNIYALEVSAPAGIEIPEPCEACEQRTWNVTQGIKRNEEDVVAEVENREEEEVGGEGDEED